MNARNTLFRTIFALASSICTVLTLGSVGPVHAQWCSRGGTDGGMDASGNQCNAPTEVAATGPASAPVQITKAGGIQASAPAALTAVRFLVKTSSQSSAPTAKAVPTSSKPLSAARPRVPAMSSVPAMSTKAALEAFCSGGMDVNGNECGEAVAAAAISRDLRDHLP